MENQPVVAPQPPQYANRKVKYYHTHKDDPGFRERLAEVQRNYYQRNRDTYKQKALDRYYRLKQVAQQAVANVLSPAV
jgi:hypothetical protein